MAYTQSQKPSFWQLLIIGYLNKIIWWKNTGHGFVDILQNLSKKIFKSDSVSEVPQKIHFEEFWLLDLASRQQEGLP